MTKTRVMFVCLGNICRSAMAECMFVRKVKNKGIEDEFYVSSAGTSNEEEGNPIYPPARRKLIEKGVEILPHRATPLRRSDYEKYDLFLCMERRNVQSAIRIFGDDEEGKVVRLLDFSSSPRDIDDPWWTGDFEQAYRYIDEGIDAFLESLKK